ncbi:MAG: response regulator [Pirellulales bacterium]|nr:response regulator [Pirellulales bacterium]
MNSTNEQKVYIIDDDPVAAESMVALVESMHIPTERFSSAEEFYERSIEHRRGCVLTDLRMRGMSGLDLLEKMNGDSYPLPVILVSAYADVPLTVRAFEKGVLTVLQKPCRDQDLWDALQHGLKLEAELHKKADTRRKLCERLEKLTTDEREVLRLVLNGLPNKTVATRLDIGLRTVEARRHAIMVKLNVSTLVELARILAENQITI